MGRTSLPHLVQKSMKSIKRFRSLHSVKQNDLYDRKWEWKVLGVTHTLADDFQYICLKLDWFRLWGFILAVYFGCALFFAMLTTQMLLSDEDHFVGELMPSMTLFEQSFWMSVGTLVSGGYGHLQPVSCVANVIVTTEFFVGILLSSILLGMVVTKASLPSVKLIFSNNCLITTRNGVRHFMVRVANTRGNLLVSPDVRLNVYAPLQTLEGECTWTSEPLEISGPSVMSPAFNLTHKITESSPLWEYSNEELKERFYSISLAATDNHTFQTLYAAKFYVGKTDLLSDVRFSDVMQEEGEVRIMDFRKFNNVESYKSRNSDKQVDK